MKRVLFILGQLSDLDIDWMLQSGWKNTIEPGTNIITQGMSIESLFIILSGEFSIIDNRNNNKEIARISSGEIVGEMSFIDSRPPITSVKSITPATVYEIPKELIKLKMQSDSEFKARFFYSIALFLSDRLKKSISNLGYGTIVEEVDEIDTNLLNNVAQAGARFSKILNRFSEV